MPFRIQGLSPAPFVELYGLSDEELTRRNARRYIADCKPGFPDRVELRDVERGEAVLLVNYLHQPAATPYHASHAIFVREGAEVARVWVDEVPEVLRMRPLSLRAFDANHWMLDADICSGSDAEGLIRRLFENPETDYLHAHFAKRGCFAARIERG